MGYPYILEILVQPTAGLRPYHRGVGIGIKVSIGIVHLYEGIEFAYAVDFEDF